jgi:multicomponent Na+:H+ antiporter subunit F
MNSEAFLQGAVLISAAMLLGAMILAGTRIVRGPSAVDRVVALDMLSLIGVAAAGMAVIVSGSTAFVEIALGLALVGFLATVAFAGFIERGSISEEDGR